MKNLLLITIFSLCICSCFNGKPNEKPSEQAEDSITQKDTVEPKEESCIEKGYYMLDKNQCLHSKICPILDSLYQVRYVDTCEVCKLTDVFYCHHCFEKDEVDKIEKKIKDYTKANEKKVTKIEPDSTNTPLPVDSVRIKNREKWIKLLSK